MSLRKAIDKIKSNHSEQAPVVSPNATDVAGTMPVYTQTAHILAKPEALLQKRCICAGEVCLEVDAYKVLRTKINHASEAKQWKSLLITSPGPSEGKTLTAVNLAISFSHAHDQTVLVVDCDLRRQAIHKRFGIDSPYGLGSYFEDNVPLSQIFVWPGIEKLTFISGGKTPVSNSAEVLGSERMKRLVTELKSRYPDRYVLFDAPPLLGAADTLSITPFVDAVLMVVEEGKTRMRDIRKAVEVVPGEKFLGFVVNRQKNAVKRNNHYQT